jgi:hypothetical protein
MVKHFCLMIALLPTLWAATETSIEELLSKLTKPKQGAEIQEFLITENAANAWALDAISKQPKLGVKSLNVDFREPQTIATEVVVDMDKVKFQGYAALLAETTLSGLQRLEVVGNLEVKDGTGVYTVEQALLNGVAIPAFLANTIISHLSKSQPPNVDVTEPFPLPYGISDVRLTEDSVVIIR